MAIKRLVLVLDLKSSSDATLARSTGRAHREGDGHGGVRCTATVDGLLDAELDERLVNVVRLLGAVLASRAVDGLA